MTTQNAILAIMNELVRATKLHSWEGYSTLDMVSVMANEAGEALREAVKIREGGGDMERLKVELTQAGAMCLRCLLEMD